MRVETVTHASRTKFDDLLNEKLNGVDSTRIEDIQFRPVLTVAKRTDGSGEYESEVLLFTALIVYRSLPPERNLPA